MYRNIVKQRAVVAVGIMRACSPVLPGVLLLLQLLTRTGAVEDLEIMKDISELRMEVEQVRNEVRRGDTDRETDNTAVLVDWLVQTVKQLQSEMRSLERRISESECAQPADITRLQDQLDSLRSNNLDLKVREERSAALIQEMKIELSQQREDKGVNGNIMQNTKVNIQDDVRVKQ